MTIIQRMTIDNAREQVREATTLMNHILEDYEQKTEMLANIINKPESARVEELKEKIKKIQHQKQDVEEEFIEGAYADEIKDMLEAYYKHLTDSGSSLKITDHKPTWVVKGTALGPYRCLECSCGAKLCDRSMI